MVLVLVLGATLAASAAPLVASAASPPSWEPDLNARGNLTFYDAAGNVVTSGSITDSPIAAYVATSGPARTGDDTATLFAAVAQNGVNPGLWPAGQLSAGNTFPVAGAPSSVETPNTRAVEQGQPGDGTLQSFTSTHPHPASDAGTEYDGVYQIRISTSGATNGQDTLYWESDIKVTGSTWAQIYPTPSHAATTSASLSAAPPSPQTVGATVTLTAAVTPGSVTGTVQFKDGNTNLGAPAPISGGSATLATAGLSSGTHSLTAVLNPADPTMWLASTSNAVSFTINAAGSPVTITTTSLPTGVKDKAYSTSLAASGGVGPYSWTVAAGGLPPGVTLDPPSGLLSGTPTVTGSFGFTAQVTDSTTPTHLTASQALSMVIDPPPAQLAISTTSLPNGTVGQKGYSAQIASSGGTGPYSFSIISGALPGGLSLSLNGVIFGTPSIAGTSTFTVQVTDATAPTPAKATKTLSITIAPAPQNATILTSSLPDGTTGVPYSAPVSAGGGTPPYQWSVVIGTLPPGLTLNPTDATSAVITGNPTLAGSYFFTLAVTDTSTPAQSATMPLSISVFPGASGTNGAGGSGAAQALVANLRDNTVTPVNPTNNTPGSPIGVGRGPVAVTYSPDGSRAYVANGDDSTISVVDAGASSVAATIRLPEPAVALEVTPDGSTLYAATVSDTVIPIPTASNSPGTPIPVGAGLSDMVISPDGSTVYTASVSTTAVTVISTASNTKAAPITLSGDPAELAITPDGRMLYAMTDNFDLVPIPTATKAPGSPIPLPGQLGIGMVASPDSSTLYVSLGGPGMIVKVNTHTQALTTLATLAVDPVPLVAFFSDPLILTPDGKTLYALTAHNSVLAIPVATGTPAPEIKAPAGSGITGTAYTAIAADTDSSQVYAAVTDATTLAGSVLPISTASNTAGSAFAVGALPNVIAFAPDQAPTAKFSVRSAAVGLPSAFDGSASTAAVGKVSAYLWNFGDGSTQVTTSPTATHVYGSGGSYVASLTVFDSGGTSVTRYYDGRRTLLNGSARAATGQTVVIGSGGKGYWMVASDGGIFSYGAATFFGSTGGIHLNQPIVGMAGTTDSGGYWLVASDGGIFSYGDAAFFGSTGSIHLNKPVVGMSPTADGKGYWLVASDGGIFSYGDAAFFGSAGSIHLNSSIVGMSPTPDGKGYWLVAADGGIFAYGDAAFQGSAGGIHLNKPVVGMSPTADGRGYWLVATDGGVFSYGDAAFQGSAGGIHLNKPVVGMAGTPDGLGYWMAASDGGIFNYGDAAFYGSAGGIKLNKPVVGIASS